MNQMIRDKLSANEINKIKQKRSFNYRNLFYVFVLSELVKKRWGFSDELAAYDSSVAQFLPIFVSPFLGYLLDRFGKRSIACKLLYTIYLFILYINQSHLYYIIFIIIYILTLCIYIINNSDSINGVS